jgi:hypothetical protein
MTPSDFFNWAFAIALAWGVIVFFMPIDKWVAAFFARRQARFKELEARITALEQQLASSSSTGLADKPQ